MVAIVAGYLVRTGRSQLLWAVWVGVGAAIAGCAVLGVALELTASEMPQRFIELFEAGVGAFAVIVLTGMVFWMGGAAKSIRATLHAGIDAALARDSQGRALIALAFFAVAREGLETVLFLIAAWQQRAEVGIEALIGALLGLATAVAIGLAIYRGSRRLNLRHFFGWTGVFILFVAAGLAAGVLRALHEAGLWNGLQSVAVDLTEILPIDGPVGALLSGMFGYSDRPTIGEVLVWFAYLIPALWLFLRGARLVHPPTEAATQP